MCQKKWGEKKNTEEARWCHNINSCPQHICFRSEPEESTLQSINTTLRYKYEYPTILMFSNSLVSFISRYLLPPAYRTRERSTRTCRSSTKDEKKKKKIETNCIRYSLSRKNTTFDRVKQLRTVTKSVYAPASSKRCEEAQKHSPRVSKTKLSHSMENNPLISLAPVTKTKKSKKSCSGLRRHEITQEKEKIKPTRSSFPPSLPPPPLPLAFYFETLNFSPSISPPPPHPRFSYEAKHCVNRLCLETERAWPASVGGGGYSIGEMYSVSSVGVVA